MGEGKFGRRPPPESRVWSGVVVVGAPPSEGNASLGQCVNNVSFNNSSRSRPLKNSMKAFCVGLPGAM
jgi:hypothetical protein